MKNRKNRGNDTPGNSRGRYTDTDNYANRSDRDWEEPRYRSYDDENEDEGYFGQRASRSNVGYREDRERDDDRRYGRYENDDNRYGRHEEGASYRPQDRDYGRQRYDDRGYHPQNTQYNDEGYSSRRRNYGGSSYNDGNPYDNDRDSGGWNDANFGSFSYGTRQPRQYGNYEPTGYRDAYDDRENRDRFRGGRSQGYSSMNRPSDKFYSGESMYDRGDNQGYGQDYRRNRQNVSDNRNTQYSSRYANSGSRERHENDRYNQNRNQNQNTGSRSWSQNRRRNDY